VDEQSAEDQHWMREALVMAHQAFEAAEVPVGSVFVRNGEVIARARNRTNELMNATRHAELEAIDHILSIFPPKEQDFPLAPHSGPPGDNPFAETTLYVTIEPCIMCASALRQVGIKRVVFGAGNERFGGNGSVLPVHTDPILNAPPYEAVGGFYREDAIMLLRRFYLTTNATAPHPRSKAKRVLKTYFYAPGVSMHGPNGQTPPKKSSSRGRRGRTRSSTPGGGSDTGNNSGSGAEQVTPSIVTASTTSKNPIDALRMEE
jgi:tRNA-specific adenosine deaminase 2